MIQRYHELKTIYPVLLAVPEYAKKLQGREKVGFLSQHARKALKISAQHSGVESFSFTKDDNGTPIPCQGIFWSITHKPSYVGGVVAPTKIGIDIENIRPLPEGLFKKTAHESEWYLAENPRSFDFFFRFWTAKEAVLKATGVGISGLLKCQVVEIPDPIHLVLYFKNRLWIVEHCFFDGHIASVIKNKNHIQWVKPLHPF